MSIVKKYKSRVISLISNSDNIYTLEFKPETGKFRYNPGQFLHLAIDPDYDGSGQWPDSRCFSMQSNPDEDIIRITYAVKGSFTRQMEQQLKVDSEVWLKLPYGDLFSRPHNKVDTVFIAGGTGVTPFLSLFTHKSFKDYIRPKIYLGFRSDKFNIYNDELTRADNSTLFIKVFYEDAEGIIDIQHIFNENGRTSDYFISGPPSMIKKFRQTLISNNISPHQILTDEWE